ncbi:MAG: histidine--tRNA ligase, partial [Paludibacteraceae bacterium]|nr:histidine--tRNA ligase [Paludibacteraceae bacterium]
DRIYDVLTMLDKFPKEATAGTRVIFLSFDQKGLDYCRPLVREVRRAGIAAEIYPEIAKMKKQMTYADNNQIPYVAIVGDSEIEAGKVMLKNMASGEQQLLSVGEVIDLLK